DGGMDVIAQAVEDEAKSEAESAEPADQQDDNDQRGKRPQEPFSRVGGVGPKAHRPPRPPASANEQAGRPVPRRRRPRHDDALKKVVEDVGDDRNPDQDLGQPEHEGHSTTSETPRRSGRSMIAMPGQGLEP